MRRGIREAEEIILRVPEEYQPPLQIVRRDLDSMDKELIRMLFHHRDQQPGTPESAGAGDKSGASGEPPEEQR